MPHATPEALGFELRGARNMLLQAEHELEGAEPDYSSSDELVVAALNRLLKVHVALRKRTGGDL